MAELPLKKLDDYIRKCRAVVHIVGNAAGSRADEQAFRVQVGG